MASRKAASLLTTQCLKNVMSSTHDHRILDVSWTKDRSGTKDYIEEHIPGALFYDLNRCVNPLPHLPRNLPHPGCFSEYIRTLGINKGTHVILYDRSTMTPVSRAWWNFKAYGHDAVSVLDGGLGKWMSEGQPTESGPMSLPNKMGDFQLRMQEEFFIDFEAMNKILETKSHQVVDTRKPMDYAGQGSEPSAATLSGYESMGLAAPTLPRLQGHMPGAIALHKNNVLNQETKCLLPKEKLLEVFATTGVDLHKPMVTLCYGGYSACLVALAATICGSKDVAVYYGSWTEYGYRAYGDEKAVIKPSKNGG